MKCTQLDAEKVAELNEWKNRFANGPNVAQAAVARKVPDDVNLDELDGIVFYCLWGVNDWRYSMIVHTTRTNGRFMTPNNGNRNKISAGVGVEILTQDLRIIGKDDVQAMAA